MASVTTAQSAHLPRVRTITLDHPWRWLSAGWLDMTTAPGLSYSYGAVFAAVGFLLLAGLDRLEVGYLILPVGFGFTLVGPIAAVGLYDASRLMMAGRHAGMKSVTDSIRRNPVQIALVGLFLTLGFIAWVRLAMLEFMLFFGSSPPPLDGLIAALLLSDHSPAFLAVGALTGGLVAAGVFAMTAVAVPMLIDRKEADAMSAMLTSFEAVRLNWRPMALWAGLIAALTLAGIALFFVGLVVALPLVGHASWHAYRDLVEHDD